MIGRCRRLMVVFAIAVCIGASTSALAAQQPASGSRPVLDRANMDTTCAPCSDFYRYVNGGWTKGASIPAAYPMWGSWYELIDRTNETLQQILEDARRDTNAPRGSNLQKLGTFYGTCTDSVRAETDGAAPLQPMFRRIAEARTAGDVHRVIGELRAEGIGVLFGVGAGPDPRNNTEVIATAGQGGLGLPDRDYYTRTDSASRRLRTDYVTHVARMLELSGIPAARAKRDADSILALETRLAEASMTGVQRRNPEATYNKLTITQANALTPHLDWAVVLRQAGAPPTATVVNIRQPEFFKAVDRLLTTVPVQTWQAYLRWHVLDATASVLSSALVSQDFRFKRNFTGATEMLPRQRRCLNATGAALGEMLGREYVERTFTPEAKRRALELVDNLRAVLAERIGELSWMSNSTRKQALVKLDSLRTKIGYPDKWRDYSELEVSAGPFANNVLRARRWAMRDNIRRIGKPIDRTEWQIPPQIVDAFALNREIVFPAGILQPPFFDPAADDAVNYGGIGSTIGHELTHHFDDGGRKFDAAGNLRDWWTPADAAAYDSLAQRVVQQFDAYTVLDSATHVNGKLTLGENISDLGGARIAYLALQKALEGKPRTPIDGFTPEQRFFISYAQGWRHVARPEYVRARLSTDTHAPWDWRVNGPLSNLPEFAKAFGCKVGDPMVRPDSLRVEIW